MKLEAISKKVFSSDIGVEPSSHFLDNLEFACRRSRPAGGVV